MTEKERFTAHVVTAEEAEQADFVVCVRAGRPSIFTDNQFGVCAHCQSQIYFRPSIPTRPVKICVECAFDLGRGGRA